MDFTRDFTKAVNIPFRHKGKISQYMTQQNSNDTHVHATALCSVRAFTQARPTMS